MKKITLLILLITSIGFSQTNPIDFETSGNGASWDWNVFENDTPALEFVENPNATGNTSATVAKITVKQGGADYAGTNTNGQGTFDLSEANSTVRIWVYKTVISDVGIKFEQGAASTGEIKVANTKINEWEEIVFDMSPKIGEAQSTDITGVVVFPDFAARTQDNTIYFDNITFTAKSTLPVTVALPLDFETATTWGDFNGGVVTTETNPFNNADNTSSNVGKMVKSAGEVYGGSSLVLSAPINFANNDTFTMKVYSPRVGAKVLLKVENSGDAGVNFEKEVLTTVANAWETLTFDYAAISKTASYDKLVLIFDNGTQGDGSANFTFYIDDIAVSNSATASVSDNTFLKISMYPNPASSKLNISAKNTIKNATIYTVLGRQVMRLEINKNSESIDISNLASGTYLIKYTIQNATGTAKFIK